MHPENQKSLGTLRGKYYFGALERRFAAVQSGHGLLAAADTITDIMREAQSEVEDLIQRRKRKGEIKHPDQARKSIAGNGFQSLVAYTLFQMQKS